MDLNKLAKEIHKNAKAHGWYDEEHSREHYFMLVITELSEAIEADRKGENANVDRFNEWMNRPMYLAQYTEVDRLKDAFECFIKGTVDEELADACIRLLSFAGAIDEDLKEVDEEYVDYIADYFSKMKEFTQQIYHIIYDDLTSYRLWKPLMSIFALCKVRNIDIEWFIEQKMKYNKLRPYKHGNKQY